jgi:peptidoglycan/LPS O-acetylase OafA/YrhL
MNSPTTAKAPGFSPELQALRGCAAMSVLMSHCNGLFLGNPMPGISRLFFSGPAAVTFFFVLSGFVLSQYQASRVNDTGSFAKYMIRRLFRILPMLMVAATLGTLYCNFIHRPTDYAFARSWFNQQYQHPIDFVHWAQSLVGYNALPASPIWSTYVELMGSVALPFMVMGHRHRSWRGGVALVLAIIACLDLHLFNYQWPKYLICFYVGVTVSSWGPTLAAYVSRWPQWRVRLFLAVCVLAWLAVRMVFPADPPPGIVPILESLFIVPVIALVFYSPPKWTLLRSRPFIFLGDISYSLYLIHLPILHLLVQVTAAYISPVTILQHKTLFVAIFILLASFCTIVISAFTYRWIELPSISLGKRLTDHGKAVAGRPL